MRNRLIKAVTGAALAAGTGPIAYPLFLRHGCLTRGATPRLYRPSGPDAKGQAKGQAR